MATIKAICQWRVASAVVMTLLMVLSIALFLRVETAPDVTSPRSASL